MLSVQPVQPEQGKQSEQSGEAEHPGKVIASGTDVTSASCVPEVHTEVTVSTMIPDSEIVTHPLISQTGAHQENDVIVEGYINDEGYINSRMETHAPNSPTNKRGSASSSRWE